jgi:hypothetical protein
METSPAPDVDALLKDLRSEQTFNALRIAAARRLGQLVAATCIVQALVTAMSAIRRGCQRQAAAALRAPAHAQILRQHPDLMQRVPDTQGTVLLSSSAPEYTLEAESAPAAETEYATCPACRKENAGIALHYCHFCGQSLEGVARARSPMGDDGPSRHARKCTGEIVRCAIHCWRWDW